ERLPVSNGVAAREPFRHLPVSLFRIEFAGDTLARLPRAGTSKPFRHKFDDDVGETADQRDAKDDERPGLQPSGLRSMVDQRDVEQQHNNGNRHGAFQMGMTDGPWWR